MKKCPKCSNTLIKVDSVKPYTKRFSVPVSLTTQVIIIYIWSAFVYGIFPEAYKTLAVVIYFAIGNYYLYKEYLIEKEGSIYECKECKSIFKGTKLEVFSYSEWSKNEYNKSVK